jgi:hypothetical protein
MLTLLIALLVHGGIALFLGMVTFGFMMLVANLVFIDPIYIRKLVEKLSGWWAPG